MKQGRPSSPKLRPSSDKEGGFLPRDAAQQPVPRPGWDYSMAINRSQHRYPSKQPTPCQVPGSHKTGTTRGVLTELPCLRGSLPTPRPGSRRGVRRNCGPASFWSYSGPHQSFGLSILLTTQRQGTQIPSGLEWAPFHLPRLPGQSPCVPETSTMKPG